MRRPPIEFINSNQRDRRFLKNGFFSIANAEIFKTANRSNSTEIDFDDRRIDSPPIRRSIYPPIETDQLKSTRSPISEKHDFLRSRTQKSSEPQIGLIRQKLILTTIVDSIRRQSDDPSIEFVNANQHGDRFLKNAIFGNRTSKSSGTEKFIFHRKLQNRNPKSKSPDELR
jgi:hypothetical protein